MEVEPKPRRPLPGWPQSILLLLLLLAGLLFVWLSVAPDPGPPPGASGMSADTLGAVDQLVHESSGLAVSRTYSGVLWSHNDSGDEPRFYALDTTGRVTATFDVPGAEAIDWEDMDLGPCPGDPGGACVYLGDIGDNARRRDVLTVYIVPEPDPDGNTRQASLAGRVRYRYPDEDHDAEALAVTSAGDLVIVTKGRTPQILLYHLQAADVRTAVFADTVLTLPPGRVLPFTPQPMTGRMVTGASFSLDDRILAIRTYAEVFFLRWPLTPAFDVAGPPCVVGHLARLGEAIAWESDSTLLLTSETTGERRGVLIRIICGIERH